ncbi:MAG: InlB B-repeat-containing protein [Acutalibacteraceae bacterium]
MRKSAKKLLSGVMAGLMVVSMAPISALAANSYEPGDVVAKEDYVTAADIAPEVDIVWTAYTGLNKAFVTNGDAEWENSANNDTYADLSKVDLTGKTANKTDFPAAAIQSDKYYVTASFILKNYGGQFGNCTLSFGWDDALKIGKRTAKGFTAGDCGMLVPSYSNVTNADGEAYLTDSATKFNDTYYSLSIATPHLPETGSVVYVGNDYTFETDGPLGGDDGLGVKLDGLYLGTVGFQVAEGTVISDDLLKFGVNDWPANDPGLCNLYMGSVDTNRMYTFTGMTEYEGTTPAMGTLKIAGNSAPETKSYTVKYVTEDGKDLGTETVEQGKSPASVPALPTKDPDAAGHYSYAWDTDPTTATISADTIFTAKLTTTPHNPQTLESNIVDATCDKDGSKTVTTSCSVCGYVISKNNVVIPATGHAWGEWKHDSATAEADATHTRVCSKDASHTETKACDFTAKVTQEATLDQAEITTYTCKDCGYSYTKETAPALAGVTVTVNAVENGSVTLAGQDVTAGGSKKFAENGTYTLVATPNADCTFVGWQTGNKIVSTDASYTTVAIADITYTPVFAESAKPVQFTFVDMFNNVISSQSVASGADVKIPQAPTYTGYTFTGWSVDEAAIKAATSSMTVYAQYEKDAAATYTVTTDADATVAYGSNSAQGTLADIPYGTQVTVSKDGATAWAIDGKIVAYGDSYTFYVASDVTVKAASATTQAPVVAAVSANQVAGSYKVEFVATRAMVDGCTYLKSGFVYGKNLSDADLTLANVGKKGSADNSGVVKAAYANSTEGSTQFILSYGLSAQNGTASAKAFLTYKDQNGKVQTVYSDVMNHTYA